MSDERDIDPQVITGIGDLLIRTLSQPLEASGAILSEKRKAKKKARKKKQAK